MIVKFYECTCDVCEKSTEHPPVLSQKDAIRWLREHGWEVILPTKMRCSVCVECGRDYAQPTESEGNHG